MFKPLVTCGAFAAIALLGATVQPVLAQTEPASVSVPYADLNLAANDGAARMLVRLEAASARVCEGHRQGMKGVAVEVRFRACRTTVLAQSIAQLGAPRVTALYAGRSATQLAQSAGSH